MPRIHGPPDKFVPSGIIFNHGYPESAPPIRACHPLVTLSQTSCSIPAGRTSELTSSRAESTAVQVRRIKDSPTMRRCWELVPAGKVVCRNKTENPYIPRMLLTTQKPPSPLGKPSGGKPMLIAKFSCDWESCSVFNTAAEAER